jgi:HipA-like protein
MKFQLYYGEMVIGELSFSDGYYYFEYSETFKEQTKIIPLLEFPDKTKKYRTSYFPATFEGRLPSPKQPKIQEQIKKMNIDVNNKMQMLSHFGERCIINSHILKAK